MPADLSCVNIADGGRVLLDGTPLETLSPPRQVAQRAAYLSQSHAVPNITAERMVLHDLCLALRTADRLAVLAGGCLQQVGTPEELFASGVLEQVFRVSVRRVRTEDGWQYYCV